MNGGSVDVMPYLLGIIGFLIVYVLNGIKTEIRDVKAAVTRIESDLHKRVSDVDREHSERINDVANRLAHIEATCMAHHK